MFSRRNTQPSVMKKYGERSSPLSGARMGEHTAGLLLLIAVWHKQRTGNHTEDIWVTLLCPAATLAKPLGACLVFLLQVLLKELWCALKSFLGFDPKPRKLGGLCAKLNGLGTELSGPGLHQRLGSRGVCESRQATPSGCVRADTTVSTALAKLSISSPSVRICLVGPRCLTASWMAKLCCLLLTSQPCLRDSPRTPCGSNGGRMDVPLTCDCSLNCCWDFG